MIKLAQQEDWEDLSAMHDDDTLHLRRALELAAQARAQGNHPFGAVLVAADGIVLAEAENTVVMAQDVTGHAELNVVRQAVQ